MKTKNPLGNSGSEGHQYSKIPWQLFNEQIALVLQLMINSSAFTLHFIYI